jgi:hypothetical protein
MKKHPPTPLFHRLTGLIKQIDELCHRTTRHVSSSREPTNAPSAQEGRLKGGATVDGGHEEGNVPLPDRVIHAEEAVANSRVKPDDPPTAGVAPEPSAGGPGQVIPPGQAPPEEQTGNAARPEWPGAGRDLTNRLDAVRRNIGNNAESAGDLQALLDQAITLLESLSQHPAIRDHGANKRKLEEIEQRLNYGAYPQ